MFLVAIESPFSPVSTYRYVVACRYLAGLNTKMLGGNFLSSSKIFCTYGCYPCEGTLDPISCEARVNALLPEPERRGPILDLLVRRRQHLLPPITDILFACATQLSRAALADFAASQAARELRPPDNDLGALARLPREILVKVNFFTSAVAFFTLLNFQMYYTGNL